MSKKKYITPQIKTLEIESQLILAGSVEPKSTIYFATDEDYEEKNVRDLRDSDGGIWAE